MGIDFIRQLKANAGVPKTKAPYKIPSKSAKRLKQEAEAKLATGNIKGMEEVIKGSTELDRWFEERRTEMTGICKHCGGISCKGNDKYFKFSIAHILPKRIFKSVATHPQNWIELCFWSPSCHTNFDNYTLDIIQLNCFDEVIEKFVAMYPDIDKKERKYIPDALLQYINA